MGFSVEEYYGMVVSHLIYKAALLWVLVRWGLRLLGLLSQEEDQRRLVDQPPLCRLDRDRDRDSLLQVMSYGDISGKFHLAESCIDTCAVCLNPLRKRDKVRQLRNCCHVFHRKCIDRWIDHDDRMTCPLCRAPLLVACSRSDPPSWAVERLLYLFGDDLL